MNIGDDVTINGVVIKIFTNGTVDVITKSGDKLRVWLDDLKEEENAYNDRLEKNIQAYMRDFGVSREQAMKDLTVPESNLDDIPTNLDEIRDMSAEELGQLLEDLTHYDDTDYEWKSNLMPLLPFEDWTDWLNRRAIYKKEV